MNVVSQGYPCMRLKGIGTHPALCNDNHQQDIEMNTWIRNPVHRKPPALYLAVWLCVGMTGLNTSAYAIEQNLPKPGFELIKGHGTDVCEAYLQRLNTTEYLNNDPAQGRVSEPPQEGFADLKPVPLTAEEIQRLYLKILSFNRYQDQDLIDRFKQQNQGRYMGEPPDDKLPELIKKYMEEDQKTPFVRFQIPLDMNNDGVANDTVIQNNNSAYFVDPGLNRIDEQRMKALFGGQEILDWPNVPQFPPLVTPLHVFNYKGKYYFDGISEMGFVMRTNLSPMLMLDKPQIWRVFLHQDYKTQELCRYKWVNNFINRIIRYHYK